jgi:hypothetical protein
VSETINGRPAEKRELTATLAGQTITIHVSLEAQWHFVVKKESAGITSELENTMKARSPRTCSRSLPPIRS